MFFIAPQLLHLIQEKEQSPAGKAMMIEAPKSELLASGCFLLPPTFTLDPAIHKEISVWKPYKRKKRRLEFSNFAFFGSP